MLDTLPETPDRPPRLLVIGEGNELAGDDAVGIELVRCLARRGIPDCTFVEMPASPLDLLDSFDPDTTVLIVDSVRSEAQPGTIHIVPFESGGIEGRHQEEISTHGFRAFEIAKLAGALRQSVPKLFLLGIEIATAEKGTILSTAAASAITYCEEHFDTIRAAIASGESVEIPVGRT